MRAYVRRGPTRLLSREILCLLGACAIAALAILAWGRIDYTSAKFATADLHWYRLMAAASPGLAPDIMAPFVYRVLAPFVVGLLPVPVDGSFYFLTVLTALGLTPLFFFFLRSFGVRSEVAALIVALFTLNKYLFGYAVWNYFQLADMLALVWLIILLWSITRLRWLMFGLVFAAGALTRETTMIMPVVALVYLVENHRVKDQWPRLLAASLPGIAVFFGLRALLHHEGLSYFVQYFSGVRALVSPDVLFRALVNPFIPFSLVPFIFFRDTLGFFRDKLYLLVLAGLVAASSLMVTDYERLMAPAFVVFYLALAVIIERRIYSSALMVAIVIAGVVASSLHYQTGRILLPDRSSTVLLSLSALALVTLACLVFRFSGRLRRASETSPHAQPVRA